MPSWIRIRIRNLCADPDPYPTAQINADPCGSGSGYGSGSETLFLTHSSVFEGVGLLLPFVCIPQLLKERNILLLVDNEPFVSSWQRRYAKKSKFTSILVQTLHILEATLPCRIFVQHRKRCSTTPATLVDKLSRASTTDQSALQATQHLHCYQPRGPLLKWLEDPVLDYQLPFAIADFVASLLSQ